VYSIHTLTLTRTHLFALLAVQITVSIIECECVDASLIKMRDGERIERKRQ